MKHLKKFKKIFKKETNYIYELPKIPKSLELLYCDNNELEYLPVLPRRLSKLQCNNVDLPYKDLSGYNKWCKDNEDLIKRVGHKVAQETLNAMKNGTKYNI